MPSISKGQFLVWGGDAWRVHKFRSVCRASMKRVRQGASGVFWVPWPNRLSKISMRSQKVRQVHPER